MTLDHLPKANHASQRYNQFLTQWAQCGLFGLLLAIILAGLFVFFRLGLPTLVSPIVTVICLFCVAFFGPLLVPKKLTFQYSESLPFLFPALTLLILVSVGFMPLIPWGQDVLFILAALSSFVALRRIPRFSIKPFVHILLIAGIIALYFFVSVNERHYVGIYTPEEALLGLVVHDVSFHTALSGMINNFGVASLGIDGLEPIKYHFGSHLWLAAFSAITNVSTLYSYTVFISIFLAPALITALMISGFAFSKAPGSFLTHVIVSFLLVMVCDALGYNSYFISESYGMGIVALLLSLPLVKGLMPSTSDSSFALCLVFGLACISIAIMMSLKVSVGLLWFGFFGWCALRIVGLKLTFITFAFVASVVLILMSTLFLPSTGSFKDGAFDIFYALKNFPVPALACLVIPLMFIGFDFNHRGVAFREYISSKIGVPVEGLVLVCIVGFLPGLLGIPKDSAVWYFMNVAQWIALPMMIGVITEVRIADFFARLSSSSLGVPALVLMLAISTAFYLRSIKPTFMGHGRDMVYAASELGSNFLNGNDGLIYMINSFRREGVFFDSSVTEALNKSPASVLLKQVSEFKLLHPDFAVYIPPQNVAFWELSTDCNNKHNVQASLTGVPSIFGAPPLKYDCDVDVYQDNFVRQIYSSEVTAQVLCERAKSYNLSHVFSFNSHLVREDNNTHDCAKF